MPNFIVIGGQADRADWIEKLKFDFKGGKAARFHNYNDLYEGQPGHVDQQKALKEADAVFLIVSATLTAHEIHSEVERNLRGPKAKGLSSDVPFYLVLKDVISDKDLEAKSSQKFHLASAKNAKEKPIQLYQTMATKHGNKTSASSQESSAFYFHDVFGSSRSNKFPANLEYTLSDVALEERRGTINKLQEKTKTSSSSTSQSGKKSNSPQSTSLASKNQTHGYTIVLKSLTEIETIEELGKNIKLNEFRLALDQDGVLHYSVLDPKYKLQTHPIEKEELRIYLAADKTYEDCVNAFKKALKEKNPSLLNPFLTAIFKLTKKVGHTTRDSLGQTHGGSRSDTSRKANKITVKKEYVIKIMPSTDKINENVLSNECRMAVSDSSGQSVLYYAVRDVNEMLQTGEITEADLKTILKPFRCKHFFTQFKQALAEGNSALVRPFLDDILTAVSKRKGCQLKANTEISDPETHSENIFEGHSKVPHGSPTSAADSPAPTNSTDQDKQEAPKKSPPKRWGKKWSMGLSSLTLGALAIVGFILEAALPTGFLATGATVGWLTTAIAGTFLASLTPVGVFMLSIFLTAFIVGIVTFCIENRQQIRQALLGSKQENIVRKRGNILEDNLARTDKHIEMENIFDASKKELVSSYEDSKNLLPVIHTNNLTPTPNHKSPTQQPHPPPTRATATPPNFSN